MKYTLILITAALLANNDLIIKQHTQDEEHYICTTKQLREANKDFAKCRDMPIYLDCYTDVVHKHCDKISSKK